MTTTKTPGPTTGYPNDDERMVDAVWLLLPRQVRLLTAPGLSADERLRRAVRVIDELARGDDDEHGVGLGGATQRVHIEIPLSFAELERTWPDARSGRIDPWYGDGDVDRANADARVWSARYLLWALDGGR